MCPPLFWAAAKVAGVDKVVQAGGAQAIAALAYGTQSVPKVDKIVGPGNIYVATAKRMLFGVVDIDMIAGPSEILVIADRTGDPALIAADLLSQAEHDKLASAILVTDSRALASEVQQALEEQLPALPRQQIAPRFHRRERPYSDRIGYRGGRFAGQRDCTGAFGALSRPAL